MTFLAHDDQTFICHHDCILCGGDIQRLSKHHEERKKIPPPAKQIIQPPFCSSPWLAVLLGPRSKRSVNVQQPSGKGQRGPQSFFLGLPNNDMSWLVVEPTHLKNLRQNGKSSPHRDENLKICFKPPPRWGIWHFGWVFGCVSFFCTFGLALFGLPVFSHTYARRDWNDKPTEETTKKNWLPLIKP